MPEKHLFEYAVIRVVPKAEREEFLNIGVILYCRKTDFLHTKYIIDEKRLTSFCAQLDLVQLKEYLEAFEKIATGKAGSGPIGKLDTASRFRWLTATRSTVIRTSNVHPGLCSDPERTLNRLHEQLVVCNGI